VNPEVVSDPVSAPPTLTFEVPGSAVGTDEVAIDEVPLDGVRKMTWVPLKKTCSPVAGLKAADCQKRTSLMRLKVPVKCPLSTISIELFPAVIGLAA
jgi:hypothetical protein